MSFYFRDRPKFGDRLRGKSGDELLQEIKQQFDEDSKSFFEPTNRSRRDPFDRHSAFSRGFPFDDDGFGRRSNIRAHLDDLAARHPKFADQLLGPPWADAPLRNSFYNRSRDTSNSGRNNYPAYSDEDARSQASGSSAASGTSAASSHSETDGVHNSSREKSGNFEETGRRAQIPQYGLRNTVDIGQHHHNMENEDRGNRGQRSMSAPPENRQPVNQQSSQPRPEPQQQQSQPQQPGQRYVSRIDITPKHNQPQQQQKVPQQQQQQQQQPQQPQQKPQQQSNVRHIPIFVEGRDEPVLPKSYDEQTNFRREPSPTQFPSRQHFPSRSTFGQPFASRHQQWSPHFQDSFYPRSGEFEQPARKQQHGFQQHPKQQEYTERQPQQQQYAQRPPQQQQEPPKQQKPQFSQQAEQQEPPKPKPNVPKDALERVALVQKEVDSLAVQVSQYSGNSRADKEYIYLDEMLTRELIKLDDIETEGRDNVRQARKNAIRTIQETISLLESKAPLPSQQTSQDVEKQVENDTRESQESMEVDQKTEERSQSRDAIPLPPGPSSPTNIQENKETPNQEKVETPGNEAPNQPADGITCEPAETSPPGKAEAAPTNVQENAQTLESSESKSAEAGEGTKEANPVEHMQDVSSEKATESVPVEEKNIASEEKRGESVTREQDTENTSQKNEEKNVDENICEEEQSGQRAAQAPVGMDVDDEIKQSPKSQKKGKKTKKTKKESAPVSDTPIPLPPPENADTGAK